MILQTAIIAVVQFDDKLRLSGSASEFLAFRKPMLPKSVLVSKF